MPGFRGTPAGMRTTDAPARAFFNPSPLGSYPVTVLFVLIWPISAATPTPRSACSPEQDPNPLTGSSPDIIKCKVGDAGVELHQQRQRLPNASRSTQDRNFRCLLDQLDVNCLRRPQTIEQETCRGDRERLVRIKQLSLLPVWPKQKTLSAGKHQVSVVRQTW